MGGSGRGNWSRSNKKLAVEESLTLTLRDFRGKIYPRSFGNITWAWAAGTKTSVHFVVAWGNGPTITLHYRWNDGENVEIPIRLQTTPTQFGGERWWFTCPLFTRGVACNRRVGKLYLPPGSRHFGCRKCHDLTYESCQAGRQGGRFLG